MSKKLNPVFLDYVTYRLMMSLIYSRYNRGLDMPSYTLHKDKTVKTEIIPIKKDHDFCFISKEENRTVVYFQGSNDAIDWVSNFRFMQGFRFGLHWGFFESALKFKKDIIKEIDPNKEIIITGHSRGGALSVFIAMFLYKKFNKNIKLMTFGSPRVLNGGYRDTFNTYNIHYNNVRNSRDPVCNLGFPLFKNLGFIKTLPVPFLWNFNFVKRHRGYYENIERLS